MDQAKELRNLMNDTKHSNSKNSLNSRVITISSGKGGVGKTNFSINLAIYIASQGKKVVIIDADFGLANVEVLLGIRPQYNFYHLLRGERTISEVMMDTEYGIKFISGGSGLRELATLNNAEIKYFIEQFEYIDKIADIIIIDTGAGISPSVTNFVMASDETIIVTTPEPTSFTDAYALIKVLKEQNSEIEEIKIVVNKADDSYEAARTVAKLSHVCEKFLGIRVDNMGHIPTDIALIKAVKKQKPVMYLEPESDFSNMVKKIGNRILNQEEGIAIKNNGVRGFMHRLLSRFNR